MRSEARGARREDDADSSCLAPRASSLVPFVSHVEWRVTGLERAAALLEGLFGWRFALHSRHYRLYVPEGGGTQVGLHQVETVQPSEAVLVHVQVSEGLEAALARALSFGARAHVAPTLVPGHGRFAQVLDFDGNVIGLFEPSDET